MSSVKNLQTRIQHKHDFEINWADAVNFIPLEGELIIYSREVDPVTGDVLKTKKNGVEVSVIPEGRTTAYTYDRFKIGDGKTTVNSLSFVNDDIEDTIQSNLISCGVDDPDTTVDSKFYFKYSK